LATFDFRRLSYAVDSDAIVSKFLSYGPLKTIKVVSPTETSFVLDPAGPASIKYIGENFKYNKGTDPTAGVINTMEVRAKGVAGQAFDITDAKIDIKEMRLAFASASPLDDLAFVAKIFAGNDSFIGTNHNDKLYGLGGKDKMEGRKGNDSLDGGVGNDVLRGNSGNDQLRGGAGKDAFVFDASTVVAGNDDIIIDFNPAHDSIWLDSSTVVYKGLAKGTLNPSLLKFGNVGDHPNGGIIYDANGDLWYDDATRPAGKIAHLDGAPTLTFADFLII
jgi:Ca2+-binding RTX toxin-like protein